MRSVKRRLSKRHRRLQAEMLEPRVVLSAGGLVPVGTQPTGGLTGKIVYTHGGHGYTANNLGSGAWSFQRPETFEMIEDLGNLDQQTYFAEYLYDAGATVVPLRPVGHQPLEVVLDNDDPEVTFVGPWQNSSSPIFFGDSGDLPYRFATTSATETAYARYQPNIPEDGFYPVYAWTRSGSDRAADQLYRIRHSGGITEVTVNHRRVGNGLVYLGTHHFLAGAEGYVDVSNRSSEAGRVVIADMIRFGNGLGDINRGGGISGVPREDESGLYWVQWHVDRSQGVPSSEYRASSDDRTAAVTFSPRYAEYMNREVDGSLSERAFVSFHSNAGGGSARGVLGLYNGNNTPSSATPNQFQFANLLATEVNNDMVAQNGLFEHNWANRTTVTLDRSDIEFGEINNAYAQNEFDATIIETGFHDNQLDAEMLRDPKVRDALARSTYQGLVRYFKLLDPTVPLVMSPPPVSELRSESVGAGAVELHWNPSVASSYGGDAATGYRVYVSENGYGFDGGRFISGGGTTSTTISGIDADQAYYFKVVAVNDGGHSSDSRVVAALPSSGSQRVLIVDGFDRFERLLNPRVNYSGAVVDRVRSRFTNSFDYSVQVAESIEAHGAGLVVDTVPNESVIDGSVSLGDYAAVVWILGEESTADDTFDATEQSLVTSYLAGGGKLFATGSEIGWDLDQQGGGVSFYNNALRSNYVADDANTYGAFGSSSGIFQGISLNFDDGSRFYDVTFPDVIAPLGGASAALFYSGGATAAIQYDGGSGGDVVVFGFPFETITTAANRAAVMGRVLDFFELPSVDGDYNGDGLLDCGDMLLLTTGILSGDMEFDANGDGSLNFTDILFWVVDLKGTRPGDANLDGAVDVADFDIWNAKRFQSGFWCDGDFNGDYAVDVSDFHIWNTNAFTPPLAPAANPPVVTAGASERTLFEPLHSTKFGSDQAEKRRVTDVRDMIWASWSSP